MSKFETFLKEFSTRPTNPQDCVFLREVINEYLSEGMDSSIFSLSRENLTILDSISSEHSIVLAIQVETILLDMGASGQDLCSYSADEDWPDYGGIAASSDLSNAAWSAFDNTEYWLESGFDVEYNGIVAGFSMLRNHLRLFSKDREESGFPDWFFADELECEIRCFRSYLRFKFNKAMLNILEHCAKNGSVIRRLAIFSNPQPSETGLDQIIAAMAKK